MSTTFVADLDVDERRRLSLGKAKHREHTRYRMEENDMGVITLTPLVSVPITAVTERLLESLAHAAEGELHPRPERTRSAQGADADDKRA